MTTPASVAGTVVASTAPTPGATTLPVSGIGEAPSASDAFVEATGVNVHLVSGAAIYSSYATVQSLLTNLGVRHIRDGAAIGQPAVCAAEQQLGAAGIHLDLITATQWSVAALQAWTACLGQAVDTIEGPNEYDVAGDPNWIATLGAYTQALYPAMKPLTVVAPSLASEGSLLAFGSYASSVDDGNMHVYFAGRNPGTPGWGATDAYGTYGSLAYDQKIAAITSGSKPVLSTETGYSDDQSDQYAVPPATKARYVMRTLLEGWNAGVSRTYLYELVDEGTPPFSHYGLTTSSGAPKPAYVALKNLLAHLADPGGTFALTALNYTLHASSPVHHALFERRTGRYSLVLWVEAPEWDPNASSTIAVAPQTVTLTFAHAPSALAATVFDDAGNVSTSSLPADSAITVTASPTIVDITP